MLFNRTPIQLGAFVEHVGSNEIKHAVGLYRASLDDAIRFGGELARHALSSITILGNRQYITVDTKIHMLIPGMYPGIPGWHTDGVPRGPRDSAVASIRLSPIGDVPADISRQEGEFSPLYHSLTLGSCHTLFDGSPREVADTPVGPDLYAAITRQVGEDTNSWFYPERWVSWDWWQLHRAQPSTSGGWRYLIRVTESDYLTPLIDLRDVLRTQQQAYLPETYGW